MNLKPSSVDDYISSFDYEIQAKLQLMRKTIREAIPEAKEVISYHMPAFRTSEVLVYFAASKTHLGFYPTNSGVLEFKSELAPYDTSKGTIRFSYLQPLPLDLISSICQFRFLEAKARNIRKSKF